MFGISYCTEKKPFKVVWHKSKCDADNLMLNIERYLKFHLEVPLSVMWRYWDGAYDYVEWVLQNMRDWAPDEPMKLREPVTTEELHSITAHVAAEMIRDIVENNLERLKVLVNEDWSDEWHAREIGRVARYENLSRKAA